MKPSAVTCLSVVGCSGHPVLKRTLKRIAADRYTTSVREDGERIKLAGHLRYSPANVARFDRHDVRAALIVRDPRDILVNLVNRSRYDWCPQKFERPRTHPDAVAFHRLLKAHGGEPGDRSFVDFYVDGIGARDVLQHIFQVAEWAGHPRVHTVRFEDLIDLHGHGRAATERTIAALAGFIGVPFSTADQAAAAARCDEWIRWKLDLQPEFAVGWQEVFSEEDRTTFERHFGSVVAHLGYGPGSGL